MALVEVEVRRLSPRLVIVPGVIAGALKLLVELALAPATLVSPWAYFRFIAAVVLGGASLEAPATFDVGVVAVALVVHFALSIAYAWLLALVLKRLSLVSALPVGVLFGLLLYVVNFHVLALLFPWFALLRGVVQLVSHVVFGGAIAASFEAMRRRQVAV